MGGFAPERSQPSSSGTQLTSVCMVCESVRAQTPRKCHAPYPSIRWRKKQKKKQALHRYCSSVTIATVGVGPWPWERAMCHVWGQTSLGEDGAGGPSDVQGPGPRLIKASMSGVRLETLPPEIPPGGGGSHGNVCIIARLHCESSGGSLQLLDHPHHPHLHHLRSPIALFWIY